MKILITGGAGYIGSVTADQLIQQGHDIIIFDNLSLGHKAAVPAKAIFVEGDLQDRSQIAQLFKDNPGIEGIMHFASYSLVGESMTNPMKYMRDNTAAAANLLQEAVDAGVKKFILSSTANLFGAADEMPIDEYEPVIPGAPYGESKNYIERMLFWLGKTHDLRYACLRYFNACGCTAEFGEDHDPETHLIPLILQVALGKRENITIFGNDYDTRDGTCIRDYVHVSDLASAHFLALQALDEHHALTYNLGNGQGYSVMEVIEAARKVSGHPIPAIMGERRPGDPPELVASSEAIIKDLGWKPEFPGIEEIVKSAWDWHVAHPNGYED